jgi:hypothetical protein
LQFSRRAERRNSRKKFEVLLNKILTSSKRRIKQTDIIEPEAEATRPTFVVIIVEEELLVKNTDILLTYTMTPNIPSAISNP